MVAEVILRTLRREHDSAKTIVEDLNELIPVALEEGRGEEERKEEDRKQAGRKEEEGKKKERREKDQNKLNSVE